MSDNYLSKINALQSQLRKETLNIVGAAGPITKTYDVIDNTQIKTTEDVSILFRKAYRDNPKDPIRTIYTLSVLMDGHVGTQPFLDGKLTLDFPNYHFHYSK